MPSGGYPDRGGAFDGGKDLRGDKRSQRFDTSQKWGGLNGQTGTSRSHELWSREVWRSGIHDTEEEMKVERPHSDEGMPVSALDLNLMERPELLTATPVKEGLWLELCEELEKLCVNSTLSRHPKHPDFALRTFELPVVGIRGGPDLKKKEDKTQLFMPSARPTPDEVPKPFVTLASGPPEEIIEQTLLQRAKFSWNGCAELPKKETTSLREGGVRPRNVAMRYSDHSSREEFLDCWIQDGHESYLEVDLGGTCNVTYVSTAGRYPPTETYPSPALLGLWETTHGTRGSGETWKVVKPDVAGWQQWVTKYQLQARLDGGRTWDTIGTLKGNCDMTTEHAHDLRDFCHNPEGLKCRYLRFLPQGNNGKPAMRIGVYGVSLDTRRGSAKKPEEEERIRYIIPVPLTNRNRRRHERDFVSRRNNSPDFHGKYGADYRIGTRRKQLKNEVAQKTNEFMGGRGRTVLARQESALYESDAGEGGDAEQGEEDEDEKKKAKDPKATADGVAPHEKEEGQTQKEEAEEEKEEEEEKDTAADEQPAVQRGVSQRVQEAKRQRPVLARTRTDDERGYCSEPEELVVDSLGDWTMI
mmetsp:Transcript_89501/g.286847  ORF Transcript_89501/g.286847 Transcript_89501/m.286847 type:complete len:585 (-) Transcript_89501:178-1932(-)|eukprot:CAMPEP_0203940642 /NCGR_PEP_ID=MMETSP0359-20131031/77181_1 /ASSEMBLY_ACC=CAM_ASM_000338 /TAXON_ID=268821 /ORGANISM="Scrippsiella Hangoei, Strain SHTV-5" /LENGTH=584 /DNA_ID=CAMNT_0050871097 /DNA_START=150 /DNA_END=1904 /DNA_ORIENTATION=-